MLFFRFLPREIFSEQNYQEFSNVFLLVVAVLTSFRKLWVGREKTGKSAENSRNSFNGRKISSISRKIDFEILYKFKAGFLFTKMT